jgi:hypothetical protein
MRGRRIAWSAVLAVPLVLAALAAPAAAQSPDDIEMDPEPATPPAKPAPTPAKPPAPDAAKPPAPDAAKPPDDGSAPAAPAAPVVKDPKVAKKWLATAQQLVQKGDWSTRAKRPADAKISYENAVTAFEKSIAAGDDLNTYALLADAEEKLGQIDRAARHYRLVVKAQAGIRPDVLKKATARFDDLATKVGVVTLIVKPDGATVSLAGTELGKAPLAEPLVLVPGTYTVALQAEGFQPREAELTVEAGSEAERTIELEAVKIIVRAPIPSDFVEPPPPPPPPPSRLPLYVGGGAAVALLGAAVVTGILAVGQHGTYTSGDATAIERDDAKFNGKRLALVSDITLAGGLVAGGFTAYWYFLKYRPAQRNLTEQPPATVQRGVRQQDGAQSAKIDLVPWVQSTASGLTVVGVF